MNWLMAAAMGAVVFLGILGCSPAVPCGPGNCSTCCTAEGLCVLETAPVACGLAGLACMSCGPGQDCRGGACVNALVGNPPPSDGGTVVTGAPCQTHAQCPGGFCSRASGRCVGCRNTDDCPSGQICSNHACTAGTPCSSDLQCAASQRVCDATGSRCVECNSAAECDGRPCLGHSCVASQACTSSLDCRDLQMVCGEALPPAWPASHLGQGCGECNSAADCGPAEACHHRLCSPVCRVAGRICGSYQGANCGSCPNRGSCLSTGSGCVETKAPSLYGVSYTADGLDRLFAATDGRNSGQAGIYELTDNAGTPSAVGIAPGGYLNGLAVNGTHLYWTWSDGTIWRRPKNGGQPVLFAKVPGSGGASSSSSCQGLAVSDAYVVCSLVDYNQTVSDGLYVFPTSGGNPVRVSPVVQSRFLVAGDYIYWSTTQVGRVPLAGGVTQLITSMQGTPTGVAQGHLYLAGYDGLLYRVPVGGGTPQAVFAQPAVHVGTVGDKLYTVSIDHSLWESGLDGSGRVELGPSSELGGGPLLAVYGRGADRLIIGRSAVVRLGR